MTKQNPRRPGEEIERTPRGVPDPNEETRRGNPGGDRTSRPDHSDESTERGDPMRR